ncbi:MAG: PLP-dependent transferase [Rikenellaceae bacterium]|nr:PLP-dependent transferase [Rikenellaceae bacterium]
MNEETLLHTPYPEPDPYGALNMPVYLTAAYEFPTAESMEPAFTGQNADPVYSRISNPTVMHFERRIARATGAAEVIAFNSGMSAITNALFAVASAGSNIVTSPHLFGNTYSFLAYTLSSFGVEARFCDLTNLAEVEKNLDRNTCALFLEVITNPQTEVADLKGLSALCRKNGVPLMADTTIVPFTEFRAKKFGVDIEIVSTTKYVSGGANSLGGVIIDYNTFDWSHSGKLSVLAGQPGGSAFALKIRREIHRNLGAGMTPHTAFMQIQGLETLAIRYRRASRSCRELARRVGSLPGVVAVHYPGLHEHPYFELSQAQFGDYPGPMFTFDLASKADSFRFLNRLRLIRRATNLFDNKSLAIHPASTIFGTFTEQVRRQMDVRDTTIRISVGLEEVEELYRDIQQALHE